MAFDKLQVMVEPWACVPIRAHEADAGLDLKTPNDVAVKPMCSATIDTGVHVFIPEGYVGLVRSKSGLMVNHELTTDGTVDALYTGSIRVHIHNDGRETYQFHRGDKIAQLVIIPVETPTLEIVNSMPDTPRGNNGFGSTGR